MFQILLAIIYLAFISLGLPDSMLGSAWPSIYHDFNAPLSAIGIISIIITFGTIVSSIQSDRLNKLLGTGRLTAISVLLTAIALFGFSISTNFIQLCLWAIPYGLGAGSVDASLNNYVALNYSSKHMNWLHCMWGVGATLGPFIMSFALTNNYGWNSAYRIVSIVQLLLSFALIISLPLWKTNKPSESLSEVTPIKIKNILQIKGAKEIILTFFFYCALESTVGLWASSFFTIAIGVSPEKAASFVGMFYIGITIGRAISGFISIKLNNTSLIRLGQFVILIGVIFIILQPSQVLSLIGLVLIGLGCAPIYPSIIHSTPERFGSDKSQSLIGLQMAGAYTGVLTIPPLFGVIVSFTNISIYPIVILILLVTMIILHESSLSLTKR